MDVGIAMFMPTMGRPLRARQAWYEAVKNDGRVHVYPCLNFDDPEISEYSKMFPEFGMFYGGTGSMVEVTNSACSEWRKNVFNKATVIGWMADDTIMRTEDWVQRVLMHFLRDDALILTVNDGHMNEKRPQSAIFMRSDVVDALGWLAMPRLNHLYVDNVWQDLRERIGEYGVHDSSILAEHMHPAVSKGEWDDLYTSIHTAEKYERDFRQYMAWVESQRDEDVAKVLSCSGR